MTTLQQNPVLRTPRMGNAAAAVAPAPASAASSGMTGADVMRVLRGNLSLIIALLIVSAVIGVAVNMYLDKNHPKFTSQGLLEIDVPQTMAAMLNRTNTGGTVFMSNDATAIEQRTHVQALRAEQLYSQVLSDDQSPIRNTSWFQRFKGDVRAAREDLTRNFDANAIAETRLISVSMTYTNPEDSRVIVQAIVDRYLQNVRGRALDDTSVRSANLTRYRSRLTSDLNAAAREREELGQRLTREGIPLTGRISPKDVEIEGTLRRLIEAQQNLARVRGQLESIGRSMTEGGDPPILTRLVEQDPDFRRIEANLRDLNVAIATAEASGENSPLVQRLRTQRAAVEASRQNLRNELMARFKATLPEELRSEEAAASAAVQEATRTLEQLKAQSAALLNDFNRYQALVAREALLTENIRVTSETLETITADAGSGGPTIRWYVTPIVPDSPSFPKLPVTLTLAVVLGLALALAIAFARELLDVTIRSPRDVAKVGGLPVLGTIQHEADDPQAAGARLPLVIAEAPQSMTAEQLRQIRTRMQQGLSLETTRSLMVTSPNPGDGKTTVAANLAAGMALVGRRVLLVDANFRRPELQKLFGVDGNEGFSTALSSPNQLATAAKATKIPNLSVLPAGPKPANAAELLESDLLQRFVEKASESYDLVIFDSGALLFASESLAMAPRVDGVVTVVRANQSSRGVLGRVRDMLKQIKAENLGVVINGIRAHGGGYYSRNIKTYYAYSNGSN